MDVYLYHEHSDYENRNILVYLEVFPNICHERVIVIGVFHKILLKKLESTSRSQKRIKNYISHKDYKPKHQENVSNENSEVVLSFDLVDYFEVVSQFANKRHEHYKMCENSYSS